MKQFDSDNKIWYETETDGTINVGFTRQFLMENMPECFHILPAHNNEVTIRGPLFAIETCSGLKSIRSPFKGIISNFSSAARNFPDRIKEDDIVATVLPADHPSLTKKQKKQKVEAPPIAVYENALARLLERQEAQRLVVQDIEALQVQVVAPQYQFVQQANVGNWEPANYAIGAAVQI